MTHCHRIIFSPLFLSLAALLTNPAAAFTQAEQRKAIIVAWDGVVPSFAADMMARGLLPNLKQLIDNGAYADDAIPTTPSKTAVGFASLWTGAPPRVTGISGNRIPRTPANQFTILESGLGFSGAALRAEPLWNTAARAGRNVVTLHAPLGTEKSYAGIHLQGYRSFFHDGVLSARNVKPRPAAGWSDVPASDIEPLEISFTIQSSTFFGLLIDDPSDPQTGYDTLVLSTERSAKEPRARLKSGAGRAIELWSGPLEVKLVDSAGSSYLRLFDLKSDGSDFLLYFTAPARDNSAPLEYRQQVKAAAGAFVGNGASFQYQQGNLGTTIPKGGDGSAEARYLETTVFVQQHFLRTARWALETPPWDLLIAYFPFPDEAEHAWRGHLDPALPGHRPAVAAKIKPYLESAYQLADQFLGVLMAARSPETIVALVSDHGMEGVSRWVAINRALQQNGLQTLDPQGRVDLGRTKAYYPAISNGYLLINTTERKNGIVTAQQRPLVVQEIQRALFGLRDGERPVVAALADAHLIGAGLGIGGDAGGDLYIELMPGYDFDSAITPGALISERDPIGNHGFNPLRPSMRTLLVLNGAGVRPGRRLSGATLIDFAPTLSSLLGMAAPAQASGRVLDDALETPR